MPAVSQAQRRYMGMAEHTPEMMRGKRPDMSKAQLHDFASTPEKGLPKRTRPRGFRSLGR